MSDFRGLVCFFSMEGVYFNCCPHPEIRDGVTGNRSAVRSRLILYADG
jgi:hypothetical protein